MIPCPFTPAQLRDFRTTPYGVSNEDIGRLVQFAIDATKPQFDAYQKELLRDRMKDLKTVLKMFEAANWPDTRVGNAACAVNGIYPTLLRLVEEA